MPGSLCLQLCIDDPFEILFSFLRPAGATLDSSEEPGMPFNAILGPLGSLVTLHAFYLGLLIGSEFVVSVLDSLGGFLPKPL